MPEMPFSREPAPSVSRGGHVWDSRDHRTAHRWFLTVCIAIAAGLLAGCTSVSEWWHNGLKVGPDYRRAGAAVADGWIDADNPGVKSAAADYSHWWTVFNDPVLDRLVHTACQQNLPLKIAGLRILEARAARDCCRQPASAAAASIRGLFAKQVQRQHVSFRHVSRQSGVRRLGWRIRHGLGVGHLGQDSPRG